jgi:protein ImuA
MSPASKEHLIAELKARIVGHTPVAGRITPVFSLGVPEIDGVLPEGGMKRGALHEVAAAAYRDMGAATGFLASLAVCVSRHSTLPVLWCETVRPPFDMGRLYGPGLSAFGLEPQRIVLALPPGDADCLWVMEEALHSHAFAAVIGELDGRSSALNLTATRRLQLAAEASGTPVLLFTGHAKEGASVAVTRWRVASVPSAVLSHVEEKEMLPGAARWHVALTRSRGGQSGSWLVGWNTMEVAFSAVAWTADASSERNVAPLHDPAVIPFRQTA